MTGRIRFLSIIIIMVALIMSIRLYFVQIVHGKSFTTLAERQNINENTISYDRGDIYFESKDGEVIPAAVSRSGFTVAINPKIIKDPEEIYKNLSKVLVLDKEEFITKTSKKTDSYEEIAKHLNTETADKIKALNIYGVTIATDKWRFYPGGKLASSIIGFVAYNEDELAGRYGLERYYEDILKKDPSKAYNNFFAEFFSNVKESLSQYPQEEGNIITSIEPAVELFLEDELKNVREKWGSNGAGGIIINPMNGEIVAMAWNPSFDLNNFKESDVSLFNNPLVENRYEMGSIIKPLTMASGIDLGTVSATSTYYDAGFLFLNNKRISNYDNKGRGTVSMQEVLNQSLNTGAAFVAMKMGNEKFRDYMKNFSVGTETGIDLPNEGIGLTNNLDSKKDISEEITRMLVGVVDKALRGGTAKIPGYSVAAKTGTAQMTDEGRAGYVEGKYLHSFFGYFPAYKPKFLVFLFHIYPKDVRYASETLTDPFLNITKFLINYYQIPPDRPEDLSTKPQ